MALVFRRTAWFTMGAACHSEDDEDESRTQQISQAVPSNRTFASGKRSASLEVETERLANPERRPRPDGVMVEFVGREVREGGFDADERAVGRRYGAHDFSQMPCSKSSKRRDESSSDLQKYQAQMRQMGRADTLGTSAGSSSPQGTEYADRFEYEEQAVLERRRVIELDHAGAKTQYERPRDGFFRSVGNNMYQLIPIAKRQYIFLRSVDIGSAAMVMHVAMVLRMRELFPLRPDDSDRPTTTSSPEYILLQTDRSNRTLKRRAERGVNALLDPIGEDLLARGVLDCSSHEWPTICAQNEAQPRAHAVVRGATVPELWRAENDG
ncbi:hypothetical protein SCHPADRAFT_895035 [Schizopora paradoxa]|uniref:Uncharacterized protein n=1 Tax=Schizopora paradoxa TaxID=27342 RepID=A0A0H2RQ84_9AGAM|nr:hypothetical protein SCHPADRAFT_895035 [Schizopora paradoxa]